MPPARSLPFPGAVLTVVLVTTFVAVPSGTSTANGTERAGAVRPPAAAGATAGAAGGTETAAAGTASGAALYREHCAACHGADRLGASGPALLPQSLARLRPEQALERLRERRPASRMPGFADRLSAVEIEAVVDHLYEAPARAPEWRERDIRASRVLHVPDGPVASDPGSDAPLFDADPLNLFLLVEAGDHHVSVLDGDRFERIHRFKSRHALHGGPKFDSAGRYVFLASRDGWISKFDLYRLETVAEVRAGINTRNVALSADDRYLLVGNYLPRTLVLLDARDLSPLRVIAVADDHGRPSRVSAVYAAPPRASFIVALKDIAEIWEIPYGDDPEPVFRGLVHDYRTGEGLAERGRFPIRRIALEEPLDDFFFDPPYHHLIGAARESGRARVVNLIVGRTIAEIDLPGMPHLGSGITWERDGTTVLASPHLGEAAVSVIDTRDWTLVERIGTLGPGFFLRSHENSPYAWVDVFSGPDHDAMHVIDKESLEIVRTLRPEPGSTSAHVEFTRDGSHALVSVWEDEGAVVVYDARTLEETARIPASRPVGKYNVHNKITRSAGTSR